LAITVFVVDGHFIYRTGVVACLLGLDGIESVLEAGSTEEAADHPGLHEAHVMLIDDGVPGAAVLIRRVTDAGRTRVVVCSSTPDEQHMIAAVQAGAVGYLRKDTLTSDSLTSAIRAAAGGAGVMTPELLGTLLRTLSRVSRDMLEPRGLSLTRLTEREQAVLRLVAAGRATREVAEEMCYSERTIKNVLHDITTKLDARTRSQAVAAAVREGWI
jgi:DNA-binding NarL/FixJ family response regulator